MARTKGRISAKRLLPVARAAGYAGSARNFRRLVAEAKAQWRPKNHRGRRPGIWAPGDMVVFDWGEIGPLFVFCAVVAWSRFRFVYFTDNLGAEATMEALAECFETIGGVPQDRAHRPHGMPEGRHGRRARHPHPGLRALRHPLRVPARLLRGGRPRVQGPGREPGRLREVRPHDPRRAAASPTWPTANAKGLAWCDEVNAVVHSRDLRRPRRAVGQRARAVRRPALPAGQIGKIVTRKVDKLSCVRFGSARYSVPNDPHRPRGRAPWPRTA